MSKNIKALIASCKLFSDLSAAEIEIVFQAGKCQQIDDNGSFYQQGDHASSFYLLLDGRVKLSKVTKDGHQILARFLEPGQAFGIVTVQESTQYPFTAQAVGPCAAMVWESKNLQDLLWRFPSIALNALQLMTEQCQEWQRRYEEVVTECVEQRIAQAVIRLVRQMGKRVKSGVLIDLPLSRQDLGEMTGTTLYTVSRILSRWEHQGLVKLGRERVIIRKRDDLVVIAEGMM